MHALEARSYSSQLICSQASVLLWTALQKRRSFFTPHGPLAFLTEFLLNVCATLFAITVYSSAPAFLNIALVTPAILLLLPLQPSATTLNGTFKTSKSKKAPPAKRESPQSALVSRPLLTNYRGGMMITTILAILAVDFPIFPRRFAKVETWGTSLMDLGVGSFVFSAGVVSARSLYKDNDQGVRPNIITRMVTATRHTIPLLILGVVRLISVKGLEYAEHVTEYGVHWNFFFTIACLPPFVELADSLLNVLFRSPKFKYTFLAIIISLVYELVLNNTRLLSYILISPRGPSLLSKNREGVFSFIGYLSIFLAGRGSGVNVVSFLSSDLLNAPPTLDQHALTALERTSRLRTLAIESTLAIIPLRPLHTYTDLQSHRFPSPRQSALRPLGHRLQQRANPPLRTHRIPRPFLLILRFRQIEAGKCK